MKLLQNSGLNTYLEKLLGTEKEQFLAAPPEPAAIRINTLRTTVPAFDKRLLKLNVPVQTSDISPLTRIIEPDTLPLSHTIDFFLGRFQYQGLSSQIPVQVLNPKPGERVLDMAAAPGSKSTQIAARMENRGSLFVNDLSRQRLQALNANLQKAGALNQTLLQFNGERMGNLFPEYFDKVLLDAPCSALGTLASNPEIAGWWSCDRLAKLKGIQQRLIIAAVKALRPGGELVYSTCSVTPEENDAQIRRVLEQYPLEMLDLDWTPAENLLNENQEDTADWLEQALHIFPHRQQMEGFFVARLRKTGAIEQHQLWKQMEFDTAISAQQDALQADLLDLSQTYGIDPGIWNDYKFIRTRNRIWMTNRENDRLPRNDRWASSGMLLAEKKQFMWKLFNQSVQFLGSRIQKRIVCLDDQSISELFASGRREFKDLPNGYHVVAFRGRNIASLYVEDGQGQIRLPHRFKLIL